MKAKEPRLNVTVSAKQHALLLQMAALQGRSAASYLREMLDSAEPMLSAILPILLQAEAVTDEQPTLVRKAIRDALLEVDAGKAQLELLDHLAGVQPVIANDMAERQASARSVATEETRRSAKPSRKRS